MLIIPLAPRGPANIKICVVSSRGDYGDSDRVSTIIPINHVEREGIRHESVCNMGRAFASLVALMVSLHRSASIEVKSRALLDMLDVSTGLPMPLRRQRQFHTCRRLKTTLL